MDWTRDLCEIRRMVEFRLPDATANKTKVVKLVVDKWFFDKGFGFGRVPTGEVVFTHASVVLTAEVLTLGTDAWVQIVDDDARAQGSQDSPRERRERQGESEQSGTACQTSAELTAKSEKVSEMCPPSICPTSRAPHRRPLAASPLSPTVLFQ